VCVCVCVCACCLLVTGPVTVNCRMTDDMAELTVC